jgi:hypothetical protein
VALGWVDIGFHLELLFRWAGRMILASVRLGELCDMKEVEQLTSGTSHEQRGPGSFCILARWLAGIWFSGRCARLLLGTNLGRINGFGNLNENNIDGIRI